MSKKLTPWFPAEVEPAREGIYNVQDRRLDDDRWFSYWDGVRFNWLSLSQGALSSCAATKVPGAMSPVGADWR